MSTRIAREAKHVTYQPVPSVRVRGEAVFARLAGHTLAGAHSRILMLRREAELAVRAFLQAGQPEQEADGIEDVRWEEYRNNPTPETRRQYERAAHRAIATTLAKLAALRDA